MVFTPTIAVVIIFAFILLASAVKICREYERGVIFRLGRRALNLPSGALAPTSLK